MMIYSGKICPTSVKNSRRAKYTLAITDQKSNTALSQLVVVFGWEWDNFLTYFSMFNFFFVKLVWSQNIFHKHYGFKKFHFRCNFPLIFLEKNHLRLETYYLDTVSFRRLDGHLDKEKLNFLNFQIRLYFKSLGKFH